MKKIVLLTTVILLSVNSFAKVFSNDKDFYAALEKDGKKAAPYLLCGDGDSVDLANVGVYFDEILTPKYLKLQIKRYGSQEKAANAAIDRSMAAARKEQHRLIENGFTMDKCDSLPNP